jgi:regulator of protease activity HflC (stomatin/prohibitin superfamily)
MNLSKGMLKTIVVERTLKELLGNRDEIGDQITSEIDRQTSPFGIKVILVEMQ